MSRLKTISIRRDADNQLLIRKGDIIPGDGWGAVHASGDISGHIPMSPIEFIERYQPHQRPNIDLVVYLEDLDHQPPFRQDEIKTVTALRKALRNPTVTHVKSRVSLLGESDYHSIPASRVKKMLKGRDGKEELRGVTLAGSTIYIEE